MGYVAGIGGANIDIHGKADGPVVMRDSNPGRLYLTMGGVMRNILENLFRLGAEVKPASVVGDDLYGHTLRAGCEALGMCTDWIKVRPGNHSSSYVSIMDDEGDMLVAMSDMHILKELDGSFVRECLPMLNGAELVVCDGNLSPSAMEELTCSCTRPLYLDPVSTTWAKAIVPIVGRFDTIKPNRMEMEILAEMSIRDDSDLDRACDKLLAKGVRRLFVSLGSDGLFYKGPEGAIRRKVEGFDHLVNATGAGDATMAGIVYASLQGQNISETLNTALAAGLIAISSADTISEQMTAENIKQIERKYLV